jgi:hypothetical protein
MPPVELIELIGRALGGVLVAAYVTAWASGIAIGCYLSVTTGHWWGLLVAAGLVAVPIKIWYDGG